MLVGELLRSAAGMESGSEQGGYGGTPSGAFGPRPTWGMTSPVGTLLRYGQLAAAAAFVEASDVLREAIDKFFPNFFYDAMSGPIQIIDELAEAARRQLSFLVDGDPEMRRVWEVIDLILAIVRGSIRFGLALDPRGFDAINDYDWREWLRLNGASQQSLDSGFMRGIYDLAFAYEDGDVTRPRLAAGVALRGAMRMFFTYRGSLFWRMSAGMGDMVFAPLYQVLKQRGVRFEFFHRLRNVGLAPVHSHQDSSIETLEFDVQASVKGGGEYQPLVDIHNVPSWPSEPNYEQLIDGSTFARDNRAFEAIWERRRVGSKKLMVARDFDFVVLGLGIGALPDVARELIEREPAWQNMVRHVKTVPTQAFQLWMQKDTRNLGWRHTQTNVSGFVHPFDTWADMSHLIPEESWTTPVQSIAYFCSVLPDKALDPSAVTESFYKEQKEAVRTNAMRFLDKDVGAFWPMATRGDGGFRWDLLATNDHLASSNVSPLDQDRFDTQFWTANVNPSDRYVQSLPGSIAYRISPLDMSFDNLTVAGDWTATGLDTGCIESAVMSGMLAAHAICQKPALHDIIGYDHP
jgi:uncharacterized protein with NAD-binding domain and iron-sulfur cluster